MSAASKGDGKSFGFNGFEPTREDLMNAASHLYGQLEQVKSAARETHEAAVAFKDMLVRIHEVLRAKEETGAELTETEAAIRAIIGSPEATQAEVDKRDGNL